MEIPGTELIQKFDEKIVSMVTTPRGDVMVATEYSVYVMRDGCRWFNKVLDVPEAT